MESGTASFVPCLPSFSRASSHFGARDGRCFTHPPIVQYASRALETLPRECAMVSYFARNSGKQICFCCEQSAGETPQHVTFLDSSLFPSQITRTAVKRTD
ncbi:hypothetical protein TRVL_08996 [Trypanosoma vivax]|nr:hypothetical protein TRVL_08996 [Trypanosoma vivax]